MSLLVTGDAVLLDLRPARVPTRMLATAIDLLVVAAGSIAWGYLSDAALAGSDALVDAVGIAGFLVVAFGYPIAMETLTRGRTVGSYAVGLQVVRDDGGTIRFRQALIRGLAFWTIDFAPWSGFCGGLVCAAVNTDSKRLGDLMAGTIVIRTRAPRAPAPVPDVPEELRPWAETAELSRVPDDLVIAARHVVQRAPGLLPYPQQQLATDLARQVAGRVAPPPPAGTEPLVFLAAVVAERRRRERERVVARQWVPTAAELPTGWR